MTDSDFDPAAHAAMSVLGRYVQEFRDGARQLNGYKVGGQWWKMRVPADEAIRWANLGFLPDEAAPYIDAGINARRYLELEQIEADAAGGDDELVRQRIARMLDSGELVRGVRDPFDPSRTILP